MSKTILLGHGSGGKLSHELVKDLFIKYFANPILCKQSDSAILDVGSENLAFTTDSYVVDPIFFPGGNIGDLAICGTVNDLAVSGAKPLFISASFIIEEGFDYKDLKKIVQSMADRAKEAEVTIVAGDTKVVNKGKCDKIFITTSGVGIIREENLRISEGENIYPGDKIIINGPIADHGMAIMGARENIDFKSTITSDTAPLNSIINRIIEISDHVHFMRDVTRGGLATILTEIVSGALFGIEINEDKIPINENVKGMCELLGFDPLYVANEGKFIVIVNDKDANKVLKEMQKHRYGREAEIIGEVVHTNSGKTILNTKIEEQE